MNQRNNQNVFQIFTSSGDPQYFVITVTNYPNLLQRTQQFQQHAIQVRSMTSLDSDKF